MSLYTDIANSLSGKGLNTAVGDAVDTALGGLGEVFGNSTLGSAIGNIGVSMARNAAIGLVNKYVPPHLQRVVNAGTGAIGDIMNGDLSNAGLRLFDSGLLHEVLPGMDGVASQARYFGTPTPLFGGITPAEARQIYQEMHSYPLCRKNLFLIEVSSRLSHDASGRFNLFATELDYAPFITTGDKRKIGAAHADIVNSSDPVELRLTTMDDQSGFIKNWFKYHSRAAAAKDGTVGVPDSYAIKIKIVHGFVTQGSNWGGYEDIGYFRPAEMQISLSRREDNMQELQLTFVQLDTFI